MSCFRLLSWNWASLGAGHPHSKDEILTAFLQSHTLVNTHSPCVAITFLVWCQFLSMWGVALKVVKRLMIAIDAAGAKRSMYILFNVIEDREKWTCLIANFMLKVSEGSSYVPEGGTDYYLSWQFKRCFKTCSWEKGNCSLEAYTNHCCPTLQDFSWDKDLSV